MKSKDLPLRLNRGRLAWAFLRKRVNVDNLSPSVALNPPFFTVRNPSFGAQVRSLPCGILAAQSMQAVNV